MGDPKMRVIGMISGTSADAIEVVACDIGGALAACGDVARAQVADGGDTGAFGDTGAVADLQRARHAAVVAHRVPQGLAV